MGSYRLILALLVLLSHCGIRFYNKNEGVMAVVSFYIISGYVITKLINSHYEGRNNITYFYADRALRLFPQFLFYLVITIISHLYFDGLEKINITRIFINAIMIPLNLFAVYNNEFIIVPQSWSLGLEMQFYILIPMIILLSRQKQISILSLVIFSIAYTGFINTDYWGYRMIPGTIFIFLLGSMLAEYEQNKKFLWTIYGLCLPAFVAAIIITHFSHEFNFEILLGILIGLPTTSMLFKLKIKNKLDILLGNMSYGVYLNHLFFFYTYNKLGVPVLQWNGVLLIIASSLTLSILTYYIIEKPVYNTRHKLRRKQEVPSTLINSHV
ncbi:acyltransferase family protein [Sodalis ligni]|uniref:Peptidoglycan/LPS O-acetylase OafA/YrhL n=1 Tax=Sodalis ligni TaxID=2697027 RepID=A0A4R1NQ00_9GAMM|nr:acyltransferase [Sodalis ligni]TCL06816.1 peptidoglycan/LPS O-acetylase OafA/YrhL [Sodalis ligni]